MTAIVVLAVIFAVIIGMAFLSLVTHFGRIAGSLERIAVSYEIWSMGQEGQNGEQGLDPEAKQALTDYLLGNSPKS